MITKKETVMNIALETVNLKESREHFAGARVRGSYVVLGYSRLSCVQSGFGELFCRRKTIQIPCDITGKW